MSKCSMDGCLKEAKARGYCDTHYMRFRKHGDAAKVSRVALKGKGLRDRFECQAVKKEGCWDWLGHKDDRGYCRIMVGGKIQLAHRVSWELHRGPLSDGQHVCHKCDNPSCTNPAHLFIGSQKDNIRDMYSKGRQNPGKGKPFEAGVANGNTSLSDSDVYAIRASKEPKKYLAAFYGVTYAQIWNIQTRRSWKHLPERNHE
jgi:hypothetical protein